MADAQKKTALDPIPYGAGTGWRSAIHPQAGSGGKLVLDGEIDDGPALAGLAAGVGFDLPAGVCRVAASTTVVGIPRIAPGFQLRPELGVTVRFEGYVPDPGDLHWIDWSLGGKVEFGAGSGGIIRPTWWGAIGDNSTMNDDALEAFTAAAKVLAAENLEPIAIVAAGTYRLNYWDLVGANRLRIVALGNVIFLGMDPTGTTVIDLDGGTETSGRQVRTGDIHWPRGCSIQLGPGAAYEYGLKCSYVIDSELNVQISGSYSVAGMDFDFSWENWGVLKIRNTYSAGPAHVFRCGNNSVNVNRFKYRFDGSGHVYDGAGNVTSYSQSIGLRAQGRKNVWDGDVSGCGDAIDISGATGNSFFGYTENCLRSVVTSDVAALADGNTFNSPFFEVVDGGTAMAIGEGAGSQGTTVISPVFEGLAGGSDRTAIDRGTQCYYLTVLSPIFNDIDTTYTGAEYGAEGGAAGHGVAPIQALYFPADQIASANAYALDDYDEGAEWTPVVGFASAGDESWVMAVATGRYTKIGDTVHAWCSIEAAVTHTTASGKLQLTGLPVIQANLSGLGAVCSPSFEGITKAGYQVVHGRIPTASQFMEFDASALGSAISAITADDVPTGGVVKLRLAVTYKAPT